MITEEQFVDILKTGTLWLQATIRDQLEEYITENSFRYNNHSFQWDSDDKLYYIYDNECYLFVYDNKIVIRCDRDNVSSSGMRHTFHIEGPRKIHLAYDEFRMMTMEDEND